MATISAQPAAAHTKKPGPQELGKPLPEGLEKKGLKNPGAPLVDTVASAEHPHGIRGRAADGRKTVLQQHVSFFARTRPDRVYPWDTYAGFRALGFNPLFSFAAIFVIHLSFSWWSSPSWIPDPRLPVYVGGIHRCKHGSDSESYDTEGRFVPEKFEELFSKYDTDNKGGLTLREVLAFMRGSRNVADPFGWFAAAFEWGTTWLLARDPKTGVLSKEDILLQYNGELFYAIEERRKREKAEKQRAREEERARRRSTASATSRGKTSTTTATTGSGGAAGATGATGAGAGKAAATDAAGAPRAFKEE